MKKLARIAIFAVLISTTAQGRAQTPGIEHQPVACAVAEKFPKLSARFAPPETLATARVVFQGQNTAEWFSVAMTRDGSTLVGVLPKPKKSLKEFRYYIEVTDKALATTRTPDITTSVVAGSGSCKGRVLAGALSTASIVLQTAAGAVGVPVGFLPAGIIAGTATGSAAGAAAASAAGGGGLSTAAVVGIVGGVGAAGAAAVVAKSNASDGGNDTGTCCAQPVSYTVAFESNNNQTGIGLVECGGTNGLFFNFQGFTPDANGRFDLLWGNPVLIRAVGQLTATTVQATMTCSNGASRSGTISATGSNPNYNGTFEFGNSRGTVTITRRQ